MNCVDEQTKLVYNEFEAKYHLDDYTKHLLFKVSIGRALNMAFLFEIIQQVEKGVSLIPFLYKSLSDTNRALEPFLDSNIVVTKHFGGFLHGDKFVFFPHLKRKEFIHGTYEDHLDIPLSKDSPENSSIVRLYYQVEGMMQRPVSLELNPRSLLLSL